jgi:gentisate 1,2-dioxygenase
MATYANQDEITPELQALHSELGDLDFVPGWNRPGNPPMWESPNTSFVPNVWNYGAARRALLRAGDLVSPEFAERRNLILVNPSEGHHYPTSRTQVVAYQMMLPGEHARTHRHSPHAGRLVLEADEGAYTIVNGTKLPMYPGDVLLTPSWSWHGHGHDGKAPAIWIDFLDVPLVHLLDPMFFERFPADWQPSETETRNSPLLFTYENTSALLDATPNDEGGYFGRRLELGARPALPTIGLYMHRLDPGTRTEAYRTSANNQYCIVEGSGTTWVDGKELRWNKGDVIVVPCWSEQRTESLEGATFLAVTDEPLQRYCGYLRTTAA